MNRNRIEELKNILNDTLKKYSEEELLIKHYSSYVPCRDCILQKNGYCQTYGNNLGCDEILFSYIRGEKNEY